MPSFFIRPAGLFAAVLALPLGALGAEPQPAEPASGPATPATPAPPALRAAAPAGATVTDELLARTRGGSDLTVIDTKLSGAVTGNAATNVSTGWNVIQGGSFANMSGIPIVVQNSGANVLIQNATVINLQLK